MATTSQTPMTMDEFLALPDDDIHRELIRGELREYPNMTTRNAKHAFVASRIDYILHRWFEDHPELTGVVVSGDARCRLSNNPDSIVGIDVAIFLGEETLRVVERAGTFEGPPLLAVEVLSPSDTHENLVEKIHLYLDAQTAQLWIVDPDLQTVTIHRADGTTVLFDRHQTLTGEPELPGFQADVSTFFALRSSNS